MLNIAGSLCRKDFGSGVLFKMNASIVAQNVFNVFKSEPKNIKTAFFILSDIKNVMFLFEIRNFRDPKIRPDVGKQ